MSDDLIEQFMNRDLPLLIADQKISSAQVLESIGVLGLLHDAMAPDTRLMPQIDEATDVFVHRLLATYPDDSGTQSEIITRHLRWAFQENPALRLLRQRFSARVSESESSRHEGLRNARDFLDIVAPSMPGEPLARENKQTIVDILSRRGK